ncbi:MAG: arsenate reductase, glutathione/glutaredoxin type [Phormidesmis sp.]
MQKVMFVCKKNSSRSQMAEGFAKRIGAGKIEVVSSGLEASSVRSEAIATMADIGIDITDQTSDALADFQAEDFDAVISLCGCGVSLPEAWIQQGYFDDWALEDPAERPEIFPEIRDEIKKRVTALVDKLA